MDRTLRALCAAAAGIGSVLAVAACGGGGGSDSGPAAPDAGGPSGGLLRPVSTGTCDALYSGLQDASPDRFMALVRGAQVTCIWNLRSLSDAPLLIAVLEQRNVLAVADAVPAVMANYDGSGSEGVGRAFLFLRVVRGIHDRCLARRSCPGQEWTGAASYSIGPGSAVRQAVGSAVDSFAGHARFIDHQDGHAINTFEMARVIIDYGLEARHLGAVTRWLNAWDERHASIGNFRLAMEQVLNILFSGHRRDGFGAVFGEDPDLMGALRDFVLDERWLQTDSHWIMDRSVLELARYSKYPGTANYDGMLPAVESVRDAYAHDPRGESIRLRLVAEIDYNDSASCARYGLCEWYGGAGFNANFRAVLFDETIRCPASACPAESISVLSQDLRRGELELACRRLHDHAAEFQALFGTNCTPVRDDRNEHLDVFVFSDGRSCEDLESAAFGRNPDTCSGIYYEGDPASPDSVAQAILTEYTPEQNPPDAELAIRSFEHEFGHYLDGRYNLYGEYRDELDSIHWWTEGFAEYFAAEVSPYIGLPAFESPYSLTETMLHSDSIPTRYAHRHLAVRFLMARHRGFVDELLGFMRRGEYEAYTAHIRSEAPKYEVEWRQWLADGPPR